MQGTELYMQGKVREAIPFLEREAVMEHPPAWNTLLLGAARTLLGHDRKHITEAAELVRPSLPEGEILAVLGTVLWDIGLREEGLAHMRRCLAISPTYENLSVCVARIEKDKANTDETLAYYQKILELQPQDTFALGGKGRLMYMQGKVKEALPLLEQAASVEHPPAWSTLGLGAVRTLLDRDRKHITEAADLVRPSLPEGEILAVLGTVLWDIGLREEGLAHMRRCLAIRPTYENLSVCVARIEKDDANIDEALGYYEKMLRLRPQEAAAFAGRGSLLVGKRLYDAAFKDFKTALELNPDEPTAHYELGNLLAIQEHYDQALHEFERAVQLGYWRLHCAHAGIGYCWYKLGDMTKAGSAAGEALRLVPDYEYAKELLASTGQPEPRG